MGEGNKKLSQARPRGARAGLPRPGLPARGPAQLPGPARLGDRGRPRRLHPRRDGRGVRHRRREPQPGPLRPQEGRGDQRRPHAAAVGRGDHPPGAARSSRTAGVVADPVADADAELLELAMPLVAERINKLTEAVDMLGFLFVDEARLRPRPDRRGEAPERRRPRRRRAGARRRSRPSRAWSTAAIQEALQAELVEALGLKPRVAFGPVRVAVTGAGSRRRCSSRWSCSAASAAWRACRARWARAVTRPDLTGLPYHLIHRTGAADLWRPVVGTIALVAVVRWSSSPVLIRCAFAVGFALAGRAVGREHRAG